MGTRGGLSWVSCSNWQWCLDIAAQRSVCLWLLLLGEQAHSHPSIMACAGIT